MTTCRRLATALCTTVLFACGQSPAPLDKHQAIRSVTGTMPAPVSVTSDVTPSVFGQPVTFTAHVGAVSPPPTGTITFSDSVSGTTLATIPGVATDQEMPYNNGSGAFLDRLYGQDTVAGATEQLAGVQLMLCTYSPPSAPVTVRLYSGHALDGTISASPIATATLQPSQVQSCNSVTGTYHSLNLQPMPAPTYFAFDTPVAVTQGQKLTFIADPGTTGAYEYSWWAASGSYAGGAVYTVYNGAYYKSADFSVLEFRTLAATSVDGLTMTTSSLPVGTHDVVATYSGDVNYASSSGSTSQTVDEAATTTTLKATSTTVYGQTATLSAVVAAVSPGAGTPTGTVTFFEGATSLGTGTLAGGVASLPISTLAVGDHVITAAYNGEDVSFLASNTTSSVTQTVLQGATSLAVTTSLTPSVWGQSVTFTASVTPVSPASGAPFGPITFTDTTTGTTLGTAGGPTVDQQQLSLYNGYQMGGSYLYGQDLVAGMTGMFDGVQAGICWRTAPTGPITGKLYTGHKADNTISATPVATVTLTASQMPSCTSNTLTSPFTTGAYFAFPTPVPVSSGETLAFVVDVGSSQNYIFWGDPRVQYAGGSGYFYSQYGTSLLNWPFAFRTVVTPPDSSISFSTAAVQVGTHTVTASYAGDANFTGSSGTTSQVVNQAASTITVSTPAATVYSQPTSLVAHVAAVSPGAGAPTGTVTFSSDGVAIGRTATVDGSGNATLTNYSGAPAGSHTITATYGGDTNFTSSTSATGATQVINVAGSQILAVMSLYGTSVFGQPATMRVVIRSLPPALAYPVGQIVLTAGGVTVGTGTLTGATSQVDIPLATLPVGTNTITATYGGDANFSGSSGTGTQTVAQASTTTALASSANPAVFGSGETLTATVAAVAPGAGTPTGNVDFFDGQTKLGSGALSNGVASFTVPAEQLTGGTHQLTAAYGGDVSFLASSSTAFAQSITAYPEATATLATDNSSPFYGQAITLTAKVPACAAPGSCLTTTPTGTVTFRDGAQALGTVALAGSSAALQVATLTHGGHQLTAVYSGDANYQAFTSPACTVTVSAANVAVAIASSSSATAYGQPFTVTATVTVSSPGAATAVGSVLLTSGAQTLGTQPLSNGAATFTLNKLPPGSASLTASFLGDDNFSSASSPSITQTVSQASTSVALTASPATSGVGQTVTITATVAPQFPGAASASGLVTFSDGGTSLGSATLSNGIAALNLGSLKVGSHTITATYAGDANYTGSTSSATAQVVTATATATTLTASTQAPVVGQPVTLTASVSGAPKGSVVFSDGATTLTSAVGLDSSGKATATATLSLGSHTLSAAFTSSDGTALPSSGTVTVAVSQAQSTVALASSASPAAVGQSITWTATVAPASPATGVPSGDVTFLDGTDTLGSAALDAHGVATLTGTLARGTHSITAQYAGDASFAQASGAVSQLVNQAATNTTVASSVTPSLAGQEVTLSSTVTAAAPATGTPTGSVVFVFQNAPNVSAALVDGVATAKVSSLPVGALALRAMYLGDPDFATSTSAGLTQTVQQGATTSALAASLDAPVYGQPLTFTVIVAPVAPAAGVPTGAVSFSDGDAALGTATLDASGKARLPAQVLATGAHSISASYAGDDRYTASATQLAVTVAAADTSVALTSSSAPSAYGQRVTFTAHLASVAAVPDGDVTFADGGATLGTVALDATGTAVFSTAALAAGDHAITASYAGSASFNASASAPLAQTVAQDGVTVTLASSAAPSTYGDDIALTATVAAVQAGGFVPTGSVTFAEGTTGFGAVQLVDGTATLHVASLGGGAHRLVATYGGDANYAASENATLVQVVQPAPVAVATQASASPSMLGQPLAITAALTPSAATGTVVFTDGGQYLGTVAVVDGTATLSLTTLPVGLRSLQARYLGDQNYAPAQAAVLLEQITKAATSLSIASSVNPAAYGQGVTLTATLPLPAADQPVPTGAVTFFDGDTQLGTALLSGAGQAVLAATNLAVATHSITAVYGGDASYLASNAPALSQVVSIDPVVVAVSTSRDPANWGEAVTVSASVELTGAGSGTPTGTVTFSDGDTTLGAAKLTADGTAALALPMLAAGTHTITATYGGDAHFAQGSGSVTQTIALAPVSVGLIVAQPSTVSGQELDLAATVASDAQVGTPDGAVTFFDGDAALGTVTLDGAGRAVLSTSSLAVGAHTLTAAYGGSARYAAITSTAAQQTVAKASAGVQLVSSAAPSAYGQAVTFTALVAAQWPATGTPSGAVTLFDGESAVGGGTLDGGKATISTTSLSVGGHTLRLAYAGDADFGAADAPLVTQVVTKNGVTLALTSSSGASTYGDTLSLQAKLAVLSPGLGAPAGAVQFFDGGQLLGEAQVDASGVAMLRTSALSGGTHTLSAAYLGDANDAAQQTAAMVQLVLKAPTVATLTVSAAQAAYGSTVQAMVHVVAAPVGVAGTVELRSGDKVIATSALNGSGYVSFDVPVDQHGAMKLVAAYLGSGNFATANAGASIDVQDASPLLSTGCSSTGSSAPATLALFAAALWIARRKRA